MAETVEAVDQTGMRALIRERLEHPELYADKPLFIWQASFGDGIQQELFIRSCIEFNRCKAPDERKYFRLITLRDESIGSDSQSKLNEGNPAGYVITTRTLCQDQYLHEVEKLIKENNNALPIIVCLPYRYKPITVDKRCFAAEQRIFTPDFEQWASAWEDTTIPDFIRGDGDEAGITYRWYNRYNDPDKGCSYPTVWLAVNSALSCAVKLTNDFKGESYNIFSLNEIVIRDSFQLAVRRCHGKVSDDIVEEFVRYIQGREDENITVSVNSYNKTN